MSPPTPNGSHVEEVRHAGAVQVKQLQWSLRIKDTLHGSRAFVLFLEVVDRSSGGRLLFIA